FALELVHTYGGDMPGELEALHLQSNLFLRVIDGANVALLDRADGPTQPRGFGEPRLDRGPRRRAAGDDGSTIAELVHGADEHAPLGTLDHGHVGRIRPPGDLALVDPDEIGAGEVAVTDLQLDAMLAGGAGHRLSLHHLSRERLAVREGEPNDVGRPEESE